MNEPRGETHDPHQFILYGALFLLSFGLENGRVSPTFAIVSLGISIWLLHRHR
jgi:hypothetical protein